MKSQKQYWDNKIKEWSFASYNKKIKYSFIEKIAAYFRSVNKRKDAALKLIGPIAKNKVILDMGCGLGEFAFGILKFKPNKVIASDISQVAVDEVKKTATKLRVAKKMLFKVGDISEMKKLPNFDIVVGLGFIDYLDKKQLAHLFKLIGNKPYLFSYFEKKFSLFNLAHKFYITMQNCPGAFKYSRKEIKQLAGTRTKVYFIQKDGLMFITNIKSLK